MASQSCPNCQTVHDTSVYVTGQKLLCRCGIRFEVKRSDASMLGRRPGSSPPAPALAALPVAPVDGNAAVDVVKAMAPEPALQNTFIPSAAVASNDSDPFANTAIRPPSTPSQPPTNSHGADSGDLGDTVLRTPDTRPQIPGYELIDVLGRGGMGEVWRARQVSLDRIVALKLLPERLASDREFVARFEKEATALASLSHPNVIQIIDRGVVGQHYFFVMEFVQGRSLRDVMGKGPLPPQEALQIVAQICQAIDYAHERGIIHRDLKPENILLDERGHAKVADFGLAGFVGGGRSHAGNLTATAVAMGTLNYMAPEQRRDAKSVDGRADLYSLGVILYELLTGELPIGRFKLPSERGSGLDVRLDQIIVRSLETDPQARYARASEIHADVQALVQSSTSWPALPTPKVTPAPAVASTSVIQRAGSGLRYGLTLIGALSILAFVLKGPLEKWRTEGPLRPALPANTDAQVVAGVKAVESRGSVVLTSDFDPPAGPDDSQAFNANDGSWTVEQGKLVAVQAGNLASKTKLRPRAYLSKRYFSSDDFTAEVTMNYHSVKQQYAVGPDMQVFGELSFRFAGRVQLSVFAIPGTGVRLLWAYQTNDGLEVIGNSAQDTNSLADDEVPPPPEGTPFRVRLQVHRLKDQHGGDTVVEAFVNGERVGHKHLVGMGTETGKLALGCRNLRCEFDELKITGKVAARPKKSVAQSAE